MQKVFLAHPLMLWKTCIPFSISLTTLLGYTHLHRNEFNLVKLKYADFLSKGKIKVQSMFIKWQ